MRFKRYLTESNEITREQYLELFKNCSQIFDLYLKERAVFYRGFKSNLL